MSVKSIVATKINPDLISGGPATVELTFFDQMGREQLSIPVPGRLFPQDLRVGERLVFIQEDKFDQLLTVEIR